MHSSGSAADHHYSSQLKHVVPLAHPAIPMLPQITMHSRHTLAACSAHQRGDLAASGQRLWRHHARLQRLNAAAWAVLQGAARDTTAHEGPGAAFLVWLPAWWSAHGHLGSFRSESHSSNLTDTEEFYGQDNEDQYAEQHFFQSTKSGTYLEMGALQGKHLSNSLHFYKFHGWRGILIEPAPNNYRELVKNRPDDICINLAICRESQDVHFVDRAEVGGIYEFMADEFRRRWHDDIDPQDLSQLPVITCHPLTAVLQKVAVRHIDFFSLDVEGAELDVLNTFPFHAVTVGVWCIEADGDRPDKDAAVVALLQQHGYQYHGHVERNDWFVHESMKDAA